MTPDDITRLAWSSKIISELAALADLRVSDEQHAAEVLPRPAVMDAIRKIKEATHEGETAIRTLAQQQSAANLVPGVMHCAKCKFRLHRVTLYMGDGTTGAGDSKTEPCPNGCGPLWPVTWEQEAREAMALANSMHEQLQAAQQQGKADGVAVYEVQERSGSLAPSSRWTETSRETYEGGYFPETLFHRRILYATPPAHSRAAGVTADAEALAMKIYAAHLAEYQRTTLGQQTWDRITEDSRNHWISVAHRLTAALAPQPKDAT